MLSLTQRASLIGVFALLPSVVAQQPPPSSPILKSTTRLVQLNVVAEDRHGRPYLGLKKEDFALTDENTRQDIAIFSAAVGEPREISAPSPLTQDFSNRDPQSGLSPSVSVILLDSLNTSFEDQVYAKQQVLKLLRKREPHEFIALYYLNDKLYVLQDFTRDSAALQHAIDVFSPQSSRLLDASRSTSGVAPSQAAGRSGNQAPSNRVTADDAIDERVRETTDAFIDIADHVAFISGRKSLIWVSGTFPLMMGLGGLALVPSADSHSNAPDLERAARALNRVNMSVYPVDTVGVSLNPGYGPESRRPAPPLDHNDFFGRHAKWDTMDVLADRTGGRAFYGNNDIAGSVAKAIDDSRSTYLLGFYPTHNQWDGSFHRLKLSVKVPGVRLRYREGYLAISDDDQPREMRGTLAEAVKTPVDSTSLDLRVTLKPVGPPPAKSLKSYIRVQPGELSFQDGGETRNATLDLLICQLGPSDHLLTADHKKVDLRLKPAEYDSLLKSGVILGNPVQLQPDARSLRIFVRDSSGALGSITIPLASVIPAPIP